MTEQQTNKNKAEGINKISFTMNGTSKKRSVVVAEKVVSCQGGSIIIVWLNNKQKKKQTKKNKKNDRINQISFTMNGTSEKRSVVVAEKVVSCQGGSIIIVWLSNKQKSPHSTTPSIQLLCSRKRFCDLIGQNGSIVWFSNKVHGVALVTWYFVQMCLFASLLQSFEWSEWA